MIYEKVSQPIQQDKVKSLQVILSQEQNREVSLTEAEEIGEGLVSLFKVLAEDESEE